MSFLALASLASLIGSAAMLPPMLRQRRSVRRLRQTLWKAEREQARAEAVLQALAQDETVTCFALDRDHRYLYASDIIAREAGTAVHGCRVDDVFPPALAVPFRRFSDKVMRTGEAAVTEFSIATQTGGTCVRLMEVAPLFDRAGRLTGVVGFSVEITELKRASEAAEAAKREAGRARRILDTFADHSPAVICVQDLDGVFLLVKGGLKFGEDLATRERAMIGRTPFEFYRPDTARMIEAANEAVILSGTPMTEEERIERSDGSIQNAIVLRFPLREEDGTIIAVCAIATAFSEEREKERRLEELTACLEAALSHTSDGVAMYEDSVCIYTNQRKVEMLSLPPHLAETGHKGANLLDFLARRGDCGPGDPGEIASRLSAQAQGYDSWMIELRPPGGRTIETWSRRLPNGTVVTTFIDVTAYRETAKALIAARQAAEEATKAKADFLANMSHELRTPLNAVIGFADLMKGEIFGPLSERYREYVDLISQSGTRLLDLINDILDLSKIEAGRIELDSEPVDLALLLADCVAAAASQAARTGCHIEVAPAEGLPILHGDPRRIAQVLRSLLNNAVKFSSGPQSRVRVRATPSREKIEIVVEDNGIGIPREEISRILGTWGQTRSDTRNPLAGSGLGLPLSKRLVELHGGSLDIDSSPGHGTTVRIRLPAMAAEWTAA